jgi:transcriptional regulator with XRE-family HTH domain
VAEIDPARLSIANRLRAAREQAGLSQGQVAKLMGVQRPTVSEIEAGRRKVAAEELIRLATMYNVDIDWITSNKPEMPHPSVELAARELAKLSQKDLETVIQLLRSLRNVEDQ